MLALPWVSRSVRTTVHKKAATAIEEGSAVGSCTIRLRTSSVLLIVEYLQEWQYFACKMVVAGSNDQDLTYGQLIGKGVLLGMLHVLSGPDHLAALVALSANVGKCRAFSVGVGWGIGHSTGLLVVATILLLSLTDTATGKVRD